MPGRLAVILILLPLITVISIQVFLVYSEKKGFPLSTPARNIKRYNPIIILSLSVLFMLVIYKNPLLSFAAQLTSLSEAGTRSFHAYRYWRGGVVSALPWYFYPFVTIFAISEVFLFLLLLGSGFVLAGLRRNHRDSLLYHTLVLFPLFFFLVMSLSQVRALRYIQPTIPFLAFVAGIGAYELYLLLKSNLPDVLPRVTQNYKAGGRRIILGVLLAGLLLYSTFSAYKISPYYRLYYNNFIGGPAGMSRIKSILWGEGHKKVIEHLKEIIQPGDRIYSYGYTDVLRYYWRRIDPDKGKNILINRKWYFPEVEYLVVFRNYLPIIERNAGQNRRERRTLAFIRKTPPVHTVTIGGVEAADIYRTASAGPREADL